MASGQLHTVVDYLRRIAAPTDPDAGDAPLLARFASQRDSDAFAALLRRHGPMVWRVCRQLLASSQDAEDAFQATFLILVRRAGVVGRPEALANWLYGVAYRIAVRVRANNAQRSALERRTPRPTTVRAEEEPWTLGAALHDEVNRLPLKYRLPVVLGYLEGKTKAEIARELGWTEGTVSGRLARARELLRTRLARRGLVGAAGVPTVTLASAPALPPKLLHSTAEAARALTAGRTPAIGAGVIRLIEGGLHGMWLTKAKMTAAVLLATGVLAMSGLGGRDSPSPAAETVAGGESEAESAQQARPLQNPALGKVKAVDADGGLITINLGSDAGLRLGNTLEVYHLKPKPTYVGTLRVHDVRPQEAIGKLMGRRPAAAVQVGDTVSGEAAPAKPEEQLRQQRQAVEEQRVSGIVEVVERQAAQLLDEDPGAVRDLLRRTLAAVRANADVGGRTREELLHRLEVALEQAEGRSPAVCLTLDRQGKVVVAGRAVPLATAGEVEAYLRGHLEGRHAAEGAARQPADGRTAVIIRAPRELEYARVSEVLKLCDELGFARLRLRVAEAGGSTSAVPAPPSMRKDEKPAVTLHVRRAAVGADVGKTRTFVVRSPSDRDEFPDLSRLGDFLEKLRTGGAVRDEVVISPDPWVQHGNVVDVLDVCHQAGFTKVRVDPLAASRSDR
jgi:RNA polymerase sigma factor (sigma-70 family)